MRPYGQQPTRLLHPQDSLGKSTGVGCHFCLQYVGWTEWDYCFFVGSKASNVGGFVSWGCCIKASQIIWLKIQFWRWEAQARGVSKVGCYWELNVCAHLRLTLCDPMAVVCWASLSMGFPRLEYWSGLPFPCSRDLPDPGIDPTSPTLTCGFFTTEPPRKPLRVERKTLFQRDSLLSFCFG